MLFWSPSSNCLQIVSKCHFSTCCIKRGVKFRNAEVHKVFQSVASKDGFAEAIFFQSQCLASQEVFSPRNAVFNILFKHSLVKSIESPRGGERGVTIHFRRTRENKWKQGLARFEAQNQPSKKPIFKSIFKSLTLQKVDHRRKYIDCAINAEELIDQWMQDMQFAIVNIEFDNRNAQVQ